MSVDAPVLRWTPEEFLDAFDKGAFKGHSRVQLIDGEVWELGPMHGWHGRTVATMMALLRADDVIVTAQTLPMPESMPDPDAWVLRKGAEPVAMIRGYEHWNPADVLLVVEVSDSTRAADLGPKARLYARGQVQEYWVLSKDTVYVHSQPLLGSYESVISHSRGASLAVPYVKDRRIKVEDLIGHE